jgi:hypothetical protein
MAIVTKWERYNRITENWDHNHISIGYDKNITKPIPNSQNQKDSWDKSLWMCSKAYLDENNKLHLFLEEKN